MIRVSPPGSNQDYGENVSPPPQVSAGGGTISTQDEGVLLSATVNTLNFVGTGVTASGAGATTTVTVPGAGSAGGQFNWGLYIAGRGNWPLG